MDKGTFWEVVLVVAGSLVTAAYIAAWYALLYWR